MHDRLSELETFGRPLDLQRYRRPLVWAPHPDDEVFGCGGLLALWAQQGVQAQVILVTGGQEQPGSAEDADTRLRESRAAAQALGHAVQAWGEADRQLRCGDGLIGRLLDALREFKPDVLLCPTPAEPHPDHQALTLALACAMARMGSAEPLPDVLLYESGGALTHADTLVDISSVIELKAQALDAFGSQEAAQPYKSRIQARDHFRAMTLGPTVRAAEAFQKVACSTLGWPAWVAALEPLFLHARGQAALPEDLPLVSVLVRTVGDAHLAQTLASVCTQTYARLEVVVVAAHGQAAAPIGLPTRHGMSVNWVAVGRPLNRPQAANAALDAARGDLLIFLDDDDLWSPEHVQKLVAAYRKAGAVRAVHTDVSVVDEQGRERTRYDQAYVPARLAFTNVFPIHSVLFERSLVTELGCRFDEGLPVLEDWDFWLQVTAHTDVPHVPGVSALYRWRDRSGLNEADSLHHQRLWRDRVQARWLERWPQDTLLRSIRWYTAALDEARQAAGAWRAQCIRAQESAARAEDRSTSLAAELEQAAVRLGRAVHDATAAAEKVEAERLAREALSLQLAQMQGAHRELQEQAQREAAVLRQDHLRERDSWVQHLSHAQQRLIDMGRELQAQQSTLQQLHALADEREQQARQARVMLEEQQRILAELRASTSWRVTRPLRVLGAWLRGRPRPPAA